LSHDYTLSHDEGAIEFLNLMLASKYIPADCDEKMVVQIRVRSFLAIKNKNEEVFKPYTARIIMLLLLFPYRKIIVSIIDSISANQGANC
jgi:hypothetical protein